MSNIDNFSNIIFYKYRNNSSIHFLTNLDRSKNIFSKKKILTALSGSSDSFPTEKNYQKNKD